MSIDNLVRQKKAEMEGQEGENRTASTTEAERKTNEKEAANNYQKNIRATNREKLGVTAEDAKIIKSLSFEELEEYKKTVSPREFRALTQTNKVCRWELATLRQAQHILGAKSIRSMMIDFAESIVMDYEQKQKEK